MDWFLLWLKKNITYTDKGLSDILDLKVRDFHWKDLHKDSDPKTTGFIAQEVQEILPYLVYNVEDELRINDSGLIPIMVKAIQEQQKQIDELKNLLNNKTWV